MKSSFCNAVAALILLAALAGCAAPGAQESWFDYMDRVNSYNAAD